MLDLCSFCAPNEGDFADEFRPLHIVLVNALGVGHYTPLIRIVPLLLSRSNDLRISIFSPIRESERRSCPPIQNAENIYQRQYFLDGPDVHPITMAAMATRQDELSEQFAAMLKYTRDILHWPPTDVLVHDPFALFVPYYHQKSMPVTVRRFVFNSSNSLCWQIMKDPVCLQALLSGEKTVKIPFFPSDASPVRIQLLWHMFSINVPDPVFNDPRMFEFAESADGAITNDIPDLYPIEDPRLMGLAPLTVVPRDPPSHNCNDSDATIAWLDRHPPRSVTYIALGTLFPMPTEALVSLADAVEAREEPFVWAYRARAEDGGGTDWSTSNERMRKLSQLPFGKVVEWTNQSAVLRHNSLKVFVSHCGWNSLVEALVSAGVPIIAIPIGAEQVMNALLIAEGLNMGEIALEEDKEGQREFDKSKIDGPFKAMVRDMNVTPTMWRVCNKDEWLKIFERIGTYNVNALKAQVKVMSQLLPGGGTFRQLDQFFQIISGASSFAKC